MKVLTPASRQSYRRRILLDLIVLLLALTVLWAGAGFPLPQSLRFHSMERRRLLDPSQVVLETELPGGWSVTVGVTEDHIHAAGTTWDMTWNQFYRWERSGEPQLILLPNDYANTPVFAAVDVPSDAVSAELTVTLTLRGTSPLSAQYTVSGERSGPLFLFTPEPQYADNRDDLALAEELWLLHGFYHGHYRKLPSHTLTFYDSDGTVISTVSVGNNP